MWSVVIPTYNRLPILQKCLRALEDQDFLHPYEIVVVDDGSTDNTVPFLQDRAGEFPHVRLLQQTHSGAAQARNLGVESAQGEIIVFIDSDLVVTKGFLSAHYLTLFSPGYASQKVFTYGRVINTCNFDEPTAEPFKITDMSRAFFATGNVAIPKRYLIEAGLFDPRFNQYGWEDLELGVRLKKLGLKLVPCPQAVGYHWHPPFSLDQIPHLIEVEKQRARMGVIFYQKHPTWEVRLMIQMTWLHWLLWGILTIGGLLNEQTMRPLLSWLIAHNKPQLALELARIFLNWYNVRAVFSAYEELKSV
ncbi:MAG: glycosyltransferase family 2 protein [Pseudanabaenaceae cyanobacterium]